MSKHLGNILEPIPLMDRHGADAVRWFMLAGGSPWSARRVGHETLSEVVRKVLLTYWNTASFFTAVRRDQRLGPGDARHRRAPSARCWTAGRWPSWPRVTEGVTTALEDFDTQTGRPAARAVRRRPVQLVRAPLAPPVLGRRPGGAGHAARVPRRAHPADGAVHPVRHRGGLGPRGRAGPRPGAAGLGAPGRAGRRSTTTPATSALVEQVALVRRLVELGRSARTAAEGAHPPAAGPGAGRRARLGAAAPRPGRRGRRRAQRGRADRARRPSAATWSTSSVKVDFRALGRRLGKQVQAVAKAVAAADAGGARRRLPRRHGHGRGRRRSRCRSQDGDLVVTETPREGWTVASGRRAHRRPGPRP